MWLYFWGFHLTFFEDFTMVKAKSKVKAKQAPKPKLQLNTLSRKSQRKEARKQKKQNRANFLSRKFDNRQVPQS